jgi:Acyl-coenzyme A:6-aminopenicillanic acid acyl-transferase
LSAREHVYFDKSGDFMTVRHLAVGGTNFEIGRTLGTLASERYGQTPDDLVADSMYVRARRLYVQRNYPIHAERMPGVAAALGLDPEDDRYDLTGLSLLTDLPTPAFGCSVVYYPPASTVTGHGYLSRNYDFFVGSIADIMMVAQAPDDGRAPAAMSEPYVMEWHPEDGGYASLAIHAFDTLSGTLDGINSAGLVVSILADEEGMQALGPNWEPHLGRQQIVGLHELAVMRLLLDTCATVSEAAEALLTVKQYYRFAPCRYLVADRSGHSFVYENSIGRNVQYVIDGNGQLQLATNFQLSKHPSPETMPDGPLTLENNAFWRYRMLTGRIADHRGGFTTHEMKDTNACVNVATLIETMRSDPAQRPNAEGVNGRTMWHSLYDQQARTVEISFYLGEDVQADGTRRERRSDYMTFHLDAH